MVVATSLDGFKRNYNHITIHHNSPHGNATAPIWLHYGEDFGMLRPSWGKEHFVPFLWVSTTTQTCTKDTVVQAHMKAEILLHLSHV